MYSIEWFNCTVLVIIVHSENNINVATLDFILKSICKNIMRDKFKK